MKFRTMKEKKYGIDLQVFAGDDSDNAGGDDQDEDDSDEDGDDQDEDEEDSPETRFTQKDVDEAIRKRLAREKRKWQREIQNKKQEPDKKKKDAPVEDAALKEARDSASKLEIKVACYEAGVAKDSVNDVTALARAYMADDEDLDLEDAIEKVVKKYPQFKKGAADPYEDEGETKKKWGERQNGKNPKLSAVEQKFYDLNPDLRK